MTLAETKEHIEHHGRMQVVAGELAIKEGRADDAQRCVERAECAADEGKLLHGDPETRDANYVMGHQKLISAATRHGLIKYDHAEPTEA